MPLLARRLVRAVCLVAVSLAGLQAIVLIVAARGMAGALAARHPVRSNQPGAHGPVSHQTTPFAADSIWNRVVSRSAALDPRSASYVAQLGLLVHIAGVWMNTYAYSTPVYRVGRNERLSPVKLARASSPAVDELAKSWRQVPIPADAHPAAGSDGHMVIVQPSTDRMWEFWQMRRTARRWSAVWGGTMHQVSSNPGYFTGPSQWGATATSLPLLGGLIRPSELKAGHIGHALAISIPEARAATFAWPAQRTDGASWATGAIPEGQRFRLDPRLNLNSLPMSPLVRMMAVAAQKYGVIVRDQSPVVAFVAEDTDAERKANPYFGAGGWFEGQSVGNLLQAFPWAHLQALRDTLSCCWQNGG